MAISLILYLFALLPRLYRYTDTLVYPDEVTWMVKGKELIYALFTRNWYYLSHAWWTNTHDAYAIGLPLIFLNGLFQTIFAGASKYSLHILTDIAASRIPGLLIGPLLLPLIYLFCTRFINRLTGIIAAVAYALSPIAIALDQWIIHDSFLTLFSFLAISSFLNSIKNEKISIIPGFWLSLAFLTKPLGLFPFITWTLIALFNYTNKLHLKLWLINIVSFFVFTSLIWPQSWFTPLTAIPQYLIKQIQLSNTGDPIHNFYLGQATDSPNWTYYLFQIFARTPEMILIFLLLSVALYFRRIKSKPLNIYLLSILAYIVSFLLFISITPLKGGVRYALPVIPWLYIAAAWGIYSFILRLNNLNKIIVLAILAELIMYPLAYKPNYYLYYNNFVGGPQHARKYDLIGLCFGNKKALEYLDKTHIPGTVGIIGCADSGPYHTSRPLTKILDKADLIILETSFIQASTNDHYDLLKFLDNRHPAKDIYENGIKTAIIYR